MKNLKYEKFYKKYLIYIIRGLIIKKSKKSIIAR